MRSNHNDGSKSHVRVELKYCEHCGGLWVREGGGGVYCEKCQPKVAELPVTKIARRPALPVGPKTVLQDYDFEIPEDADLEAAGGAA